MTDRLKEQLSAFLDGELPDPESALLLKRLERDDELRGALSRYSLIGAVLRSDGDVPAARQVAARVSAAIAKEPFRAAVAQRLPPRDAMLRGVAGLAVAAGVAFGAVLLVQQVATQEPAGDALVASTELPVQPVVDDVFDAPAEPYVTPPAADVPAGMAPAELANYLVAHYGYASPLVRRSVGAGLISDDPALEAVPAPGTPQP
jgi:negative regulator of sigma E activity